MAQKDLAVLHLCLTLASLKTGYGARALKYRHLSTHNRDSPTNWLNFSILLTMAMYTIDGAMVEALGHLNRIACHVSLAPWR
jgi:hypothetical protein